MKRSIIALAAIATISALAGCNSNNSSPKPAPAPGAAAPAPQTGPAWALSLKTSCSPTLQDESCVGKYGFTVDANGAYTVGPAPAGNTLTGKISAQEMTELTAAITKASALSVNTSAEAILDMDYSINDTNTLSVKQNGNVTEISHATGAQFFYKGTDSDAAWALYTNFMTLANAYYTTPFPDTCSEAASAFAATYESVQGCQADSDCSYVNANYDIVPPSATEYIYADTCSVLAQLTVGNTKIVLASKAKLTQEAANVEKVCMADTVRQGDMIRSGCAGRTGFEASANQAPVCGTDHMCHLNSGINL